MQPGAQGVLQRQDRHSQGGAEERHQRLVQGRGPGSAGRDLREGEQQRLTSAQVSRHLRSHSLHQHQRRKLSFQDPATNFVTFVTHRYNSIFFPVKNLGNLLLILNFR